ncbi:Gfo/Idh/MocA family protein [Bacteroidota bacterium]
MKTVKWGIIGCGDVNEVKSGPAFGKVENSELIAVMRRDGKLAEDFAKRHNVPKWYDSADELINDSEINAVYIATPPSSHKKYTLDTAKAGKPIYVEKPMSTCYTDCLEMMDACEKANVPLYVAYYRRSLPRFLKIKELITDGVIGNVKTVKITLFHKPAEKDLNGEYNWRVEPAIAGGGYFFDLGCHQLDLLQFYFGDIQSAMGVHTNQLKLYDAEDTVSAVFTFPNDIVGNGMWNFNSWQDVDNTIIIGDKGSITYSTFVFDPIIVETNDGREEITIDNPHHIQLPLIQDVVNDILGKGKSPSTGYTGAQTNKVLDLIYK